ncbi:MAG: hypothetical protein II864_07250 [Prevotella sp.]|nr:hypothetical protein [Prevotella sp.]
MKTIVKMYLGALLLCGGEAAVCSCTDYQDEIDALDYRVKVLEELVDRVNTDIDAMEVIIGALEDADYITGVKETADGYLVNFAKAGPIEIKDGIDGKDGKDAEVPDIDVQKDKDGNWYWVIDGQPVTDGDGNAVRVNGKDGKDGADGKDGVDGKDAVSPQLRINPDTGMWEVSPDGGETWNSTGTSSKGKDGKDGIDGKDGADGKDGNQFFLRVNYEVTDSGEFMTVTTQSGQTFRIPIYKNA